MPGILLLKMAIGALALAIVAAMAAAPGSPDIMVSSAFAAPASSTASRRTCRVPVTGHEGPVIYALLLGLPEGRWSEALNSKHRRCEPLQHLVKAAFLSAGLQGGDCVPVMCGTDGATVVGIARMVSWSTNTVMSTP